MRRTLLSTLATVGLALAGAPATVSAAESAADTGRGTSFDVGLFAGGHFFNANANLGVAATPDASAGPKSNALAGLRAGLGLNGWSTLEVEVFGMLTADRTYQRRADLFGYRLNLLAYLLSGNLRPYLLVGAGAIEVAVTQADGNAGLVHDRDGEFHVGGGIDYRLRDHLALRLDGRAVQMPGKQDAALAADIEGTLAVAFVFGAGPRPPTFRPAEPRAERSTPAAVQAVVPAPAPSEPGREVAAEPPAPTAAVTPAEVAEPATAGLVAEVPAKTAPAEKPAAPADAPKAAAPPPASLPAKAAVPVVAPARTALPSVKELMARAKEIRFEGSSSKLSLVSLPLIGQLAEALTKDPGIELEIVAHTGGSGDAAKDMALSKRRAEAVKRALVDREVAGSRLVVTGRGSEDPLAPNLTRSGRKLNERIELRLSVPDKVTR
jgi:outer membrane protein OmpA-like peptidoglycan-associated protein